jgi:hypothetical protein
MQRNVKSTDSAKAFRIWGLIQVLNFWRRWQFAYFIFWSRKGYRLQCCLSLVSASCIKGNLHETGEVRWRQILSCDVSRSLPSYDSWIFCLLWSVVLYHTRKLSVQQYANIWWVNSANDVNRKKTVRVKSQSSFTSIEYRSDYLTV